MKKTVIKGLSVMLAVVLTLTAAPLSGFVGLELPKWLDFSIMSKAAITGSCGENVTWTYDDETCTLTISGSGAMNDFKWVSNWNSYNRPWENFYKDIKVVVIEKGITTIGDYSFTLCTSLTSITIPEGIISIGNLAFRYCKNLTSITIPESVEKIGISAFEDCDKIINITIPDGITEINEGTFWTCNNLTNVTIPNSVTSIGGAAFRECPNLISIKIPSGVSVIDYCTFLECRKLTKIIIPKSVTTIGERAFLDCKSLTDVYYSGTEEEWNKILIESNNDPLLNATIHFNYCEHNFVDGTCIECGRNKPITQEMSSQIRFNRNADGSYAKTFDVRTRAMISDEDFKSLVGATDTEAIKNIDKIGFVYTINGENFSAESAQAVAQGETVSGYVDAPVKYIQDAGEYYMFTCLVTDIPAADRNYTLTAYAYICVNGKWYFSEEPMNADFNALYEKNYPIACEKYGWEV